MDVESGSNFGVSHLIDGVGASFYVISYRCCLRLHGADTRGNGRYLRWSRVVCRYQLVTSNRKGWGSHLFRALYTEVGMY